MALVHEDGTGKADAESYVSVTDANAYHTANNNATWTGADAVKEAALRKATRHLDGLVRWPGWKKTAAQALAWPRSGAHDREEYAIDDASVPSVVKSATAELALRALSAELAPDLARGGAVKRQKVGPVEREFDEHAPGGTSRPWLDLLLAPILPRPGRLVRG
jgi:hypothetical protein